VVIGGDLWISDVTMVDGTRVDIRIDAGMVAKVHPTGEDRAPETHPIYRGQGWLVHGALVEPHAHLDKAYLAERAPNPSGDLMGAIEAMQSVRHTTDEADIVSRADRAVDAFLARGTLRIRTHADTTLDNGYRSIDALVSLRDRRRSEADIQVAALLDWPLTGRDATARRAMAREAVDRGADLIGGCPHLDDDPRAAVEWLLDEALDLGVALDLHADENMRPDSRDLEMIADVMLERGVSHPVTASHCVSLSAASGDEIRRVADKVALAGISVVSLPQTNLFLQGRGSETARPRGIAPVRALARAGVIVAAGGDNMQDPFHPFGKADPYEVAALMVLSAHVPVVDALDMVTGAAVSATGGRPSGPAPGHVADLVLVPRRDVRSTLAESPYRRTVIRSGRVARDANSDRK
jgi:cytosine deaminase